MYIIIFQRLILEALFDFVYFPVWWYTFGFKRAVAWAFEIFKSGNRTLAPGLWLKNIFVPMYGQYDWEGKLISFVVRSANVVGRLVALTFWLVICLMLAVIWLSLPIVVFYFLFRSLVIRI